MSSGSSQNKSRSCGSPRCSASGNCSVYKLPASRRRANLSSSRTAVEAATVPHGERTRWGPSLHNGEYNSPPTLVSRLSDPESALREAAIESDLLWPRVTPGEVEVLVGYINSLAK